MKQLSNSVTSLLDRKSKPRVRLSADFAFSTFWLLPRLPQLRSDLGEEIEIQILASQVPPDPDDDDCDVTIHVNSLSRMLEGDVLLLEEKVAAVCSPGFLKKNGAISSSTELLDTQLLSLSKPPSAEWQTWQGWFDSLGIVGERSQNYVSFNNYDMVTQSAVAGHGVALGWLGLVDDLLQNGLLVRATTDVVTSAAGYVMSRDYASPSRGPALVFDWIANQVNAAASS
ncbi:LysR substrate-binding domain-containing protein [Pelagibius sp. Alg239-R121]|uniref:LysR substrate-binding domain-containing protein n=1 Tax=Pelagibius sp. Alg239-R121 TaxID=2993448 RepID=UPI0024A62ADB|nr:LysR substrate-binding domain-containing protein [Pelagibius sp. Alg239-R121]